MATAVNQSLYIHARCPECGSQMVYDGGAKGKLRCTKCSYNRGLGRNSDQVAERKLEAGVKLTGFQRGLQFPLTSYSCEACAAQIAVDEGRKLAQCPFCLGEELTPNKRDQEVLTPYSIIPFSISQSLALRKVRAWMGRNRFLPDDIVALKQPERMVGIYLPLFLFDALTRSSWLGETGFSYFPDPKNQKNKKMAWEPTAGYYEHFFQDLELGVSEGIDEEHFEEIGPYELRKLIPYDPKYLKSFAVELYNLPELDGFKLANMLLDQEITDSVYGRISGEDLRKFKLTSEKHSVAFRHVLVPVWLASYRYQDALFQVMINGQSGVISGDKPIDTRKAVIAGAAIVALTILLVLLVWW